MHLYLNSKKSFQNLFWIQDISALEYSFFLRILFPCNDIQLQYKWEKSTPLR